jgi:hypothetical protein
VSKGVQTGNQRRGSGRVTPAKVRRGVVIAVDGALVLGTGALGGLFGTGPASAAAPNPGWTGAQTPAPTATNPPGSPNPGVAWSADSCVSAAFCAAGGAYIDSGDGDQAMLGVKAGGTWSVVEAPLPSNADTSDSSHVNAISCASDAMCVATGYYKDSANHFHGLIETLSGGTWSPMDAPLPSDAQPASEYFSYLKSVDCQSAQSCYAVGDYDGTTGSGGDFGLIDTYSGGVWSATAAPQPSDAGTHQDVVVDDVSCPSLGSCAAAGSYTNGGDRDQALVFAQTGGSWSVTAPALPAGSGTGTSEGSELDAISCSGALCEAAGFVADTSGDDHGLLAQGAGTSWSTAMAPEPANGGTGTNQDAGFSDVSCTFDGICNAVGFYDDQANDATRPLIDTVSGATITATEGPQPADEAAAANVDAGFDAVSCVSGQDCSAVGTYTNNSGSNHDVALLDSSSGGTWSNTVAPVPANAGSGANANSFLSTVDCSSRSACEAVGDFEDGAGNEFGLNDTYTPPEGYWSVASDGGIFNYGTSAPFWGSRGGQPINAPMVGMAATPGGGGYWEVGSDGGIFSYGNALFHGSTGSLHLNAPIVGMAATPDGLGYWLVASDGGIFNYGDAGFYGSAGSIHLNKPIVGMATTPDGHGYWLVASDGGIFSYGDALFYGSRGGQPLNKPIVGMTSDATGLGYWLVASDGGIFTYGDGLFYGSRGGQPLNKPIVGMMSTFDGAGYWLVASDGGIFSYGDTGFYGSAGSIRLNAPVVNGTAS